MMVDPDTAIRMIDTAFYNGVAVGIAVGVIVTCITIWVFEYTGGKNGPEHDHN